MSALTASAAEATATITSLAHLNVSVWAAGQQQARQQRGERYSSLSVEHPGKMLPAIARYAITAYTRPG